MDCKLLIQIIFLVFFCDKIYGFDEFRFGENVENPALIRVKRETILIHIQTLSGKTFDINVEPSSDIYSVKGAIRDAEGLSEDIQRLIFGGRQLDDDKTVSAYNIQNNSIIHLVLRTN